MSLTSLYARLGWHRSLLGFVLLLWIASSAQAAHLYQISIPVTDTTAATRAEAANQVLSRLLVRLTGEAAIAAAFPPEDFAAEPELYQEDPAFDLWQSLSEAQQWVAEFSYQSTAVRLTDEQGRPVPTQLLVLTFDEQGIRQLIRRMGYRVWDSTRPRSLMWILLDGRQGRYLVNPSTNAALAEVVEQQAQERGIPVTFADLTRHEQEPSLLSDLWGGFAQQILRASQVYEADHIVVARISSDGQRWVLLLSQPGLSGVREQRLTDTTLGGVLRQAVNATSETLAQHYGGTSQQHVSGQLRVRVTGIETAQDLAQVLQRLQRLSVVESLRLHQAQAQMIELDLNLNGNQQVLRANLALDSGLVEVNPLPWQLSLEDQSELAPVDLILRWQR
ncbi:DUF2066 domain-containing protein [Marinospirillum sp. MEB164]|uniref:DUF2066 domain-containing protein n=1 Tax=Marinospirillum alkalitolerans TaxID=3123374 RepID=A0ABW8PYF5_9GAMM